MYISYTCSGFFYTLTKGFGSHSGQVVKEWLEKICEHVNAAINYTERRGAVLVNHANRVRAKSRNVRHGRNQHEFLDKTWILEILPSELCVTTLRAENCSLKAQLEECEAKCCDVEHRSQWLPRS